MEKIRIIGLKVSSEIADPKQIQPVFTMYGNIIRTRLGLHEEEGETGKRFGIILMELVGDEEQFDALQARLESIEGVSVQSMDF